MDWKGLLTINQLRCRVLTNRILGQCEYVPVPLLPTYKEVEKQAICSDDDLKRENLCISLKYLKNNKFRLLIILPSDNTCSSQCFTLDLDSGVFYACNPLQMTQATKIICGFVFSIFLNQTSIRAFPQFDEIKACDIFAGEGRVYDVKSISHRIFYLKQIEQFPFQILIPKVCPSLSQNDFTRYEVLNPVEIDTVQIENI